MSKVKKTHKKFTTWWAKSRLSKQLSRDIMLILLGICFSTIIQQNQVVQEYLYAFIPQFWRLPLGLIIIFVVVGFLFWGIYKMDVKSERYEENLLYLLRAVAKKLGVTKQDIEDAKSEYTQEVARKKFK